MDSSLFYTPMPFTLQMAGADMAVTMLQLLTAATQAAEVLTDSTLTVDQLHTVLCVCGQSHTDTSHQEELSSSRCLAQRRTSLQRYQ